MSWHHYKFTISEFELWASGYEFGSDGKFVAEHFGTDEEFDDPIWDQIYETDSFIKFNTKMTCLECKSLRKPSIIHGRSTRPLSVMQIPVQVARIWDVFVDDDGNEYFEVMAEGIRNNPYCDFVFSDTGIEKPKLMYSIPDNYVSGEFYFSDPDFRTISDIMIEEGVI